MGVIITQIFLRLFCVLLLVAAIICVTIGKKLCIQFISNTFCDGKIPVSLWQYDNRYAGQYFVLVASLILIVSTLFLLVLGPILNALSPIPSIVICALSGIIALVCFCLESWYAAGAGQTSTGNVYYVQSYIAAAIFYFVLMVLYFVDCGVSSRI